MPVPLIPIAIGAAGLGIGFGFGRATGGIVQAAVLLALVYLVAKKFL